MSKAFQPKYDTAKAIDTACKAFGRRGLALRQELHELLVSAVAHHAACIDSGGSIGTVLSKVYATVEAIGALHNRGVKLWLTAIFGDDLKWSEKNKTFSGKVKFNPTFIIEGQEYAYHQIPFWELKAAKEEQAWDWKARLKQTFDSKKAKGLEGAEKAEFEAYASLYGLMADKVLTPEVAAHVASALRAEPAKAGTLFN